MFTDLVNGLPALLGKMAHYVVRFDVSVRHTLRVQPIDAVDHTKVINCQSL